MTSEDTLSDNMTIINEFNSTLDNLSINELKHGIEECRNEHGILILTIPWKNGVRDGIAEIFNSYGVVIRQYYWQNGIMIGCYTMSDDEIMQQTEVAKLAQMFDTCL
jgi:antitoxin component YwqK of YwqJK toxin-antitoxin module